LRPWKGEASYYDDVVSGKVNKGAAWYYAHPSDAAIDLGFTQDEELL
jgi:uncharacterized protein (DUF427 family)